MSTRATTATAATPNSLITQVPHEKISMRAYEKWCKRGCPQGTEKLDWLEAEAELRTEMTRTQGQQAGPRQTAQPQTTQQRR